MMKLHHHHQQPPPSTGIAVVAAATSFNILPSCNTQTIRYGGKEENPHECAKSNVSADLCLSLLL